MAKSYKLKNIKEFKRLTAWGTEFAKKKGIRNEKDVVEIIHKGRAISDDEIPSMEEMFKLRDKIKQKRKYTTEEIVKIGNELREKR